LTSLGLSSMFCQVEMIMLYSHGVVSDENVHEVPRHHLLPVFLRDTASSQPAPWLPPLPFPPPATPGVPGLTLSIRTCRPMCLLLLSTHLDTAQLSWGFFQAPQLFLPSTQATVWRAASRPHRSGVCSWSSLYHELTGSGGTMLPISPLCPLHFPLTQMP
jgi:hypothetical protein